MRRIRNAGVLAIALWAASAGAQTVPETFTATASVKKGEARASAPATVTVTRYASSAERDAVMKALRETGMTGARKVLAAMSDAGFIELGEKRTPIKLASVRPTDSGRLVTLVTSEPMLHLGAGLGELAPAAKIGLDKGGAILIEDYGPTVMWLKDLTKK
jgi:hypothetical protein